MTILRGRSAIAAGPTAAYEAAPGLPVDSTQSDTRGIESMMLFADAVLVRSLEEAGAAFLARLQSVVTSAITEAFGEISREGLAHRAVMRALEIHDCHASAKILVHPGEATELSERLVADGLENARAMVECDPLIGSGQIVLQCVYGRLHLGPAQLARRLSEDMTT